MSDAPFKCDTLGRLIFTCAAQRRDLMRIVHGTLSSDNAYDNEPDLETQTIDIDARYAKRPCHNLLSIALSARKHVEKQRKAHRGNNICRQNI